MHVVTGVFSFTGGFVARELLARGESVTTLSRRPEPSHPLAGRVSFGRLQFDDPAALAAELRGASTLFNTYWIRFPRGHASWEEVVANTRTLLRAAQEAGVARVVQFSVTNADAASPHPYFRAKAAAEEELRRSGLPHAIVRPTLLFGRDDVLFNNIAWALRRSPLFVVPRGGGFAIQPVSASDVARLAVEVAAQRDDVTVNAAGPVVYSFREIVTAVRDAIGARSRIAGLPLGLVLASSRLASLPLGDILVTRDELAALQEGLLVSREHTPAGAERLEDWLAEEADRLGQRFVSERRRNWT